MSLRIASQFMTSWGSERFDSSDSSLLPKPLKRLLGKLAHLRIGPRDRFSKLLDSPDPDAEHRLPTRVTPIGDIGSGDGRKAQMASSLPALDGPNPAAALRRNLA
jgi:hypothetical protein